MITEDLSIYEKELAQIDADLQHQNDAMPIEYFKRIYPVWDAGARHYYAQQLHVSVADLHTRYCVQQGKCSCCARRFAIEDNYRPPVLSRRRVTEPFNMANILLRCPKCAGEHKEYLEYVAEMDCSPRL